MCKQLKPSTCETTCKRSLVHMLQWLWLSQLFWPTTPAFFHEKNLKRRKVAPSISRSQFAWIHSHNRGQLRHGRIFFVAWIPWIFQYLCVMAGFSPDWYTLFLWTFEKAKLIDGVYALTKFRINGFSQRGQTTNIESIWKYLIFIMICL